MAVAPRNREYEKPREARSMFIPDLVGYCYWESYVRPGLLAVGWLDPAYPTTFGDVPEGFQARLWLYCKRRVVQTRGLHGCEFCTPWKRKPVHAREGEEQYFGDAEIRVFSPSGEAFAAPDMIYHYVEQHGYLPPANFIDAVMTGPLPGTPEYEETIKNYTRFFDGIWQ